MIGIGQTAFFTKEELIYLVEGNGSRWITDFRSLDEIEELTDPRRFFRANRQFLVHRSFIKGYRADDAGKLHLAIAMGKPPAVLVSKDKAAAFKQWLL